MRTILDNGIASFQRDLSIYDVNMGKKSDKMSQVVQ
jgi:hypothetical protein